ncbi:DUF4956 domain-containing protein [Nocardioides ferulae]|uniref:DUF4956 domain-containing protein n=1 Tax=Nocardioides ferulae TaxID=2340821 RepID=UPI000EB5864D|nr:DUF4956 domain-containing protein [Nocardioides ferulae]
MTTYLLAGADLAAVLVLALGVYFPRHRRSDLVTAFVAVNVGVLAVTVALSTSAATIGLGLGLFGVLSIIRLRSAELGQHEIAYYFASLALGLLGGLGAGDPRLAVSLMGLLVVVVAVADSGVLQRGARQQIVVLDSAITDEAALRERLEVVLAARVHRAVPLRVDLVNDSTTVDVRYARAARPPAVSASESGAPDALVLR